MALKFISFEATSGKFKGGITDIGTDNVDVAFEGIEKGLVDWCQKQIELFQQKLKSNNSFATGNLYQGFTVLPFKRFGKNYQIEVSAPEYWKTLEYGQRGNKTSSKAPNSPFVVKEYPDLQSMVKWVEFKGIARGNAKFVYKKASGYQRLIYNTGTWAHPFVQPTLTEERLQKLAEVVADYTAQAIVNIL
jgi:hypothetical protein